MRRLLSIISVVLIAGGLLSAQPASAQPSPTTEAPAGLQRGPAAKVQNTCTDTLSRLHEFAASGKDLVACTRPTSVADKRPKPAVADNPPVPEWCQDLDLNTWWIIRDEACAFIEGTLNVYEARTGALVGQLFFLEVNYAFTSARIHNWQYQIVVDALSGWGQAVGGTTLSGHGWCTGDCTGGVGSFPGGQPVDPGLEAAGDVNTNTTATARWAIGNNTLSLQYRFHNPKWTLQPQPLNETTPNVRCDTALPGVASTGCIFSLYEPVLIYALDGPYYELAQHIRDAQASGLPGAYGSGTYLHRLTDSELRRKNRAAACPASLPRPPGKSCDEYPMASTWEGAHTSGGGFSRRMIDEDHNSLGGVVQANFYRDNRVLEADPFTVWIR
ncbi:NucA/NucB deoxyribonuclease domain-containing protein [Amycolatopsis aidingensis]|uniref:NucA/NucB deoxyribonuclease domain-containing protein n=1 Tax=Amycolatopsis aidingensis TaxID=2842453 RepID=UPI001C0C6C56|nr:hypothetical protein [Amycolatopsis aidingensis]